MASIKIFGLVTALIMVMSIGLVAAEIDGPGVPPPCDPATEECPPADDDNGDDGNGDTDTPFDVDAYMNEVCPADSSSWKNHGGYVSCVAQESKQLVTQGLITSEERSDLISAAAQSCIGMPPKAACN